MCWRDTDNNLSFSSWVKLVTRIPVPFSRWNFLIKKYRSISTKGRRSSSTEVQIATIELFRTDPSFEDENKRRTQTYSKIYEEENLQTVDPCNLDISWWLASKGSRATSKQFPRSSLRKFRGKQRESWWKYREILSAGVKVGQVWNIPSFGEKPLAPPSRSSHRSNSIGCIRKRIEKCGGEQISQRSVERTRKPLLSSVKFRHVGSRPWQIPRISTFRTITFFKIDSSFALHLEI